MTRRAYSLTEAIIASLLICVSFLVLFSIFTSSSSLAVQSRNRSVAMILAQSWMEEIRAHAYGAPAPDHWAEEMETPVVAWVEGRPQDMNFWKTISYANGSFIGNSALDFDEVTIIFEWEERVGDRQTSSSFLFPPAFAGSRARHISGPPTPPRPPPNDPHTKKLQIRVPVWR